MTPSGIEPATFRFVARHLNHCATAVPGETLRVPGGWGPQVSIQSAHEDGKVVSLKHRPLLPPGNTPGTHFCCRLSRPQCHSAAGRIMSINTPMTPSGIEPATFRLVAQHLNNWATAVPTSLFVTIHKCLVFVCRSKQLYLSNHSVLDTCIYEVILTQWQTVSFRKIFTFLTESVYRFCITACGAYLECQKGSLRLVKTRITGIAMTGHTFR